METGQCLCKPGVTGGKCGRCLNGFWNYGPDGCQSCGCNTDFAIGGGCNQLDGQCECLPGVVGQNCDSCPPNWILIMNETRTFIPEWKMPFGYDEGCFPCSSCVGDLMDTTNAIINALSPIMEEFKETEKSYYAYRRLTFISNEIDRLKPEIALLDPDEGNRRLRPLELVVATLQMASKSLNVDFKAELMRNLSHQAEELSVYGSNVVAEMGEVGIKIMEVIKDVNDVSEYLGEGAPNSELLKTSIKKGNEFLDLMKKKDFSEAREAAVQERDLARAEVVRARDWSSEFNQLKDSVDATEAELERVDTNLDDLKNQTTTAFSLATEAKQGNFRNTAPKAQTKVARIEQLNTESAKKNTAGQDLVTQAEDLIADAKTSFDDLRNSSDYMGATVATFNDRSTDFDKTREEIFELERQAAVKGDELTATANEVKGIVELAKVPGQAALQAASAYADILAAINQAELDAQTARVMASGAMTMSQGVSAKVNGALKGIETMSREANQNRDIVDKELEPKLASAKLDVDVVTEQTKVIKQDLGKIAKEVEAMEDMSGVIAETQTNAAAVQVDAHDALTSINARTKDIEGYRVLADRLSNNHTEMNLYLSNTKKTLMAYEEAPDRIRRRREAYVGGGDYDINTRLSRLEEKKNYMLATGDRVSDLVTSIRTKISSARESLAQIEAPGVTMRRGSSLELQVPPVVEDLGLKTDVSLYVNISNSGTSNERDFLFYLGNLKDTYMKIPNTNSDDYMALQVLTNGSVSLIMDTGTGRENTDDGRREPLELVSKIPVIYNDWVKIDVNRRGYMVNLTVSVEREIGNVQAETVTGLLPFFDKNNKPTGAIFNLNKEFSKIFVGGFSTEQKVQETISSTDMEGQIEGLKIGGQPVGLWNLKASKEVSGAATR